MDDHQDGRQWMTDEREQQESERWRPVFSALDAAGVRHSFMPGYPDYLVTDSGEIYSARKLRVKKLVGRLSVRGYECVTLFNDKGGKHFPVHRAVAITFLGPPSEPNLHVNHMDGCKTNNAASNLEWCTNAENMAHSRALGLHKITDEQKLIFEACAKERRQLQSHEAAEIRRDFTGKRGELRVMAKKYGVDYRVIWKLVHNMTYREIKGAA
jgi:hypothetical protein